MERQTIADYFEQEFFQLISHAHQVHIDSFGDHSIETCVLSNIKTGKCPEDCAYCPQSAHYKTSVDKATVYDSEIILAQALAAKAQGAKRFCMGAAWKYPTKKDFPMVLDMIRKVKALGMETCVTLGTLNDEHVAALKSAGLDVYNHNLDTSESHYKNIITTRTFQERIETLEKVADAGISSCCGGILGMGETREDRIDLLHALTKLKKAPLSIPINQLIPIPGTPLENSPPVDTFEFIRMCAVTRILFPCSFVRLSAGREQMSDEMQAWCFYAGANSIFIGDTLLTAKNPSKSHDDLLLERLDLATQ